MKQLAKQVALGFVAGLMASLALVVHLGPDALIQAGTRWNAASREYLVTTEPVREMDESLVASAIEARPTKPAKARR